MRFGRIPLVFTTAGREALASAKQAWLLRHDAGRPVVPDLVADGEDVVVFLHGLFATAGVLRPMRAAITAHAGVHAAALSYLPGPGVIALAARLHELMSALPSASRIHLVGHSLGGIVVRYFADSVGDARIVQTISMATPFAGIPNASLLGFDGARDMDSESILLRDIRLGHIRSAQGAPAIPHLSIVAEADVLMRSPVAHALPGGDVVVMSGRGHNTLLYDLEVIAIVERRVLSYSFMGSKQ